MITYEKILSICGTPCSLAGYERPVIGVATVRHVLIGVETADALGFTADVLALKYAQGLFGVDEAAYSALADRLGEFRLPTVSEYVLLKTNGAIQANLVLFVGVQPLHLFGYQEIREFARSVFASLAAKAPDVAHVALTTHGANYGRDEIEAFKSEVAGILDALASGTFPDALAKISFVEIDRGRAQRLRETLRELLPSAKVELDPRGKLSSMARPAQDSVRTAGAASDSKSRVFVAMPFAKEMDDLFHYGIQGAVNAAGFLCERADLSAFTGDVMEWVKTRIETSKLVIADLTTSNPNVYLEIGYAWGCRVPTVLIVREAAELKFDVKGQRAITYSSIRHLEESLGNELNALKPTLAQPRNDPPSSEDLLADSPIYYDRVPSRELAPPATRKSGRARAISPRSKTWPIGSTLRIRFMGGSPAQHAAVKRNALAWTAYANLHFQFTDAQDAEIRVAFDEQGGCWSYIGNDAREVPKEFPTMNLSRVDPATVLHQFGRAIGLNPEHQNPQGGIQWNEAVVIQDLSGAPNYWDADTTRRQMLNKYSVDHMNGRQFDSESIMVLPIPARWTLDGTSTSLNRTLSVLDKALVERIYPRS